MLRSDITQITAHYRNVIHGHKGFFLQNKRPLLSRIARNVSLRSQSAAIAITRPQGRTRYLKISNIRPVWFF